MIPMGPSIRIGVTQCLKSDENNMYKDTENSGDIRADDFQIYDNMIS